MLVGKLLEACVYIYFNYLLRQHFYSVSFTLTWIRGSKVFPSMCLLDLVYEIMTVGQSYWCPMPVMWIVGLICHPFGSRLSWPEPVCTWILFEKCCLGHCWNNCEVNIDAMPVIWIVWRTVPPARLAQHFVLSLSRHSIVSLCSASPGIPLSAFVLNTFYFLCPGHFAAILLRN